LQTLDLPLRIRQTRPTSIRPSARSRRISAAVSSVEPSSMQMISMPRTVCWRSDRTQRRRLCASLWPGMITLMEGSREMAARLGRWPISLTSTPRKPKV
jgi:hypothetical protein